MVRESLFKRLYKKSSVLEDFVTEAFAGVLASLTDNRLNLFFHEINIYGTHLDSPSISTQTSSSSGRHDLVIEDENTLIIFENKWESPTYLKQLHDYDNYLANIEKKLKVLIHLTKDYAKIEDEFKSKFYKISWNDVYLALKTICDNYVTNEFLKYLREERVAMEKVTWELINGSKSVYDITRVIERAAQELNKKHSWSSSGSKDCYLAQTIDDKLTVYFLIKEAKLYFSVYGFEKPPCEEMTESYFNQSDLGFYFDFDKYCFFHKSLEQQVEIMKETISALLKKI